MKSFLKVFVISFICFTLLLTGGAMAILKMTDESNEKEAMSDKEGKVIDSLEGENNQTKEKSELQKLVEESSRINILLLGLESTRTDTIILASFDPKNKSVDLVSVPRDTYYYTKGYEAKDQKKINAVYGRSKAKGGGAEGIMKVVSNVLKVPVHQYISFSYSGVESIVDALDGVEVNIPFNMYYDDPYSDPPLHIHFKKGAKVLKGEEAIEFLRFRKNNDGSHSDGDLGRINRQQQFIKSAAKKALSYRLPFVANTAFKFVKTSMDLSDIIYYAKSAIGISMDDINTYKLPGNAEGIRYYIHDPQETEKLMIEIYKKGTDS